MKKYVTPQIETTHLSKNDILLQSDVLIDGSHLFDSEADGN